MNVRRILLFASLALAAAVAGPATASATELSWTKNHTEHLTEEQSAEASFEGVFEFTRAHTGTGETTIPHSTFGCEATVKIKAEGLFGGKVTEFKPTTATCKGTGIFTNCKLKTDKTNIGEGWKVTVTTEDLLLEHSNATKDITIQNEFEACDIAFLTTSHLEFKSMSLTPSLNPTNGTIEELAISGSSTTPNVKAGGSFEPESSVLGLTEAPDQLSWTKNHTEHLTKGQSVEASFEGNISFTRAHVPGPPTVPQSSFTCPVTVKFKAEGTTGGTVTEFNPTTTECLGTGIFTNCHLIADKTNISEVWKITVTTEDLLLEHADPTKDMTLHNEYTSCASGITTTHLEFRTITLTPSLNPTNGTIEELAISGSPTVPLITTSGSLKPESSVLGLTED